MKFFPTNINLNVNIPKLNFNGSVTSSSNSQFLDHLNLLLTKSPQKGGILDKDVTGNDVSLAFIFLLLMTSNEKIAQSDLTKNGSNVQSELKNKSSVQLNNLLDLLKKEIKSDSELKKMIGKLQQYLNIKDYKSNTKEGDIDAILIKLIKINFVESDNNQRIEDNMNLDNILKKIYEQLGLDDIEGKVKNNEMVDLKKINRFIKDINVYIKDKHPELFIEINKFIKMNLANKKNIDVILNDKLEPDKRELKNSLVGNNLKLVIEKLDKLNKQIKDISQNIYSLNNEDEYLDFKNIKDQIADLQKKVFDIAKENRDFSEKGQMQKTIEQIVHNIGLLQDKIDNIESELLKAGMEVPLDKRFLKSGGDKGFNHPNDFASGPQMRSFVLDNANQGRSVPIDSKFRDEIFRQIERGIFKNLGEGKREVSIKLHPPELGALKVVMQVHNKEVSMILHTEHRDVADALNKHIANFEKSFEQQGLKVVKVEVKNDLFSGGENFLRDFTGSRDHAQNNSSRFKRRNLFDFSLLGEGDISAMDHENMASLVRMNSGSLYVIA